MKKGYNFRGRNLLFFFFNFYLLLFGDPGERGTILEDELFFFFNFYLLLFGDSI